MAIILRWLLTDVLITSCAIFALVYFYFRHFLYSYWRKKGVVYVEPTTPIGNLGSVLKGKMNIGELYADAYAAQKRNRYFGMYTFNKPRLVIAEPDIIKEVLTRQFSHFYDRGLHCNEQVDPLSAHLFFLSGSKWRNLRTKITPTFTPGKIRQMFTTMVDCGEKMTQHLKPKALKEEVINFKDLTARFAIDVIMATAFGISCNSIDNPSNEFLYWGRKTLESRPLINVLMWFAPKIMDLFSVPFTDKKVATFFTTAFKDTVAYREANDIARNDFLNSLMQLMRRGYVDDDEDEKNPKIANVREGKITIMEGVAQAFVFFLAGFETGSSVITNCLYELARNQDIQDKVANEIDSSFKKFGGFTYEGLQEMTYLHKVVSETLRKYPSLPTLDRVCTKDIVLPTTNLRVSKGLLVVIPILGLHRDPDIYPDPDKFDPERFNDENIAARHSYAYLPFGEGPRNCIGMKFGLVQIKIGLISILSKYRVKMGPNAPVRIEWLPDNFVMISKHAIDLIVEAR